MSRIRLFPKEYVHRDITQASDEVIAAYPLPAGTRVNNLWLNIHIVSGQVSFNSVAFYAIHGYIVPVPDPDNNLSPDDLWDRMIPKDEPSGSDVLDLDSSTADTAPVFELGDMNLTKLMGMSMAPQKLFTRQTMLSGASGVVDQDRSAGNCRFVDVVRAQVKSNYEVEIPSYLLIGFSSPDTLATSTGFPVINTDAEWSQLQYLEYTLEDTLKHLTGLTEAGAETPYEDAMTMLQQIMEVVFEESAGRMAPVQYQVGATSSIDMSVQGSFEAMQVSAQP